MESWSRAVSGRTESQPYFLAGNDVTSIEGDNAYLIKGGTFIMGTNEGFPYEGPAHEVTVESFWIGKYEVTVAEFARFVEATRYRTEAEKFGWAGVFDIQAGGWKRVDGATWRCPDGPGLS